MSRPTYENSTTLENEQKTREVVEKAWKVKGIKVFKKYGVDDYLMRGEEIHALAEYKTRNLTYETLSRPIILSAHKIMQGRQYARQAGVSFFIIFNLHDGYYFVNLSKVAVKFGVNKTSIRDDPQDIEPVGLILKEHLTKIKE